MLDTKSDGAGYLMRAADSPLSQEIEFLAVKAFAQGARVANRYLSDLGLRARPYSVLAMACTDLEPTQRDLAEFLSLDPSQIVALVDELERDGLVLRLVDPSDRRSKIIQATEAGRTLFAEARLRTRAAEDEALGALTTDEHETLRRLLRKLVFGSD